MGVCWVTYDIYENPNRRPGSIGDFIPGGCAFYRCMLPMRALGLNAMGRPAWSPTAGFGIALPGGDALYGFRTAVLKLLMGSDVPHQIEQAKAAGQRIVIDIDDFYEDLPDTNLAKAGTDPSNSRTWNRDNYAESILLADTVTVSTPFLLEHYSRIHPDVRMVRNGVLPVQFHQKKPDGQKPTIGWVGAIPWKAGDIDTLNSWLPDFLEEHDLNFFHAGDGEEYRKFTDIVNIPAHRFDSMPGLIITEYHLLFMPIDIGLVPLEFNNFNEAKSNIKGLEYALSGVPFVASATGEYRYLEQSGVGRTASTPQEWRDHVTQLLDYKTRRREAAENARLVRENHSIQARAKEWRDVLLGKDA